MGKLVSGTRQVSSPKVARFWKRLPGEMILKPWKGNPELPHSNKKSRFWEYQLAGRSSLNTSLNQGQTPTPSSGRILG